MQALLVLHNKLWLAKRLPAVHTGRPVVSALAVRAPPVLAGCDVPGLAFLKADAAMIFEKTHVLKL